MDKFLTTFIARIPDNVFPEAHKVSGSIDEQPYFPKVKFIKQALVGHSVMMLAIAVLAFWPILHLSPSQLIVSLAFLLILLTSIRFFLKSGRIESTVSFAVTLLALPFLGQLGHDIHFIGYAIESLLVAGLFIGIYTLCAGRDFNFSGMVVICSLGTLLVLLFMAYRQLIDPAAIAFSWLLAVTYLVYIAYDLAMILKRRRMDEQLSVMADFLRDLLNFTTYPVRIFAHWRSYRFQS